MTNHQQTEEICRGRCAVDIYKLRSILHSAIVRGDGSIDRRKYLQTGVSMGMRAMRSVLCSLLRSR